MKAFVILNISFFWILHYYKDNIIKYLSFVQQVQLLEQLTIIFLLQFLRLLW